MCRCQASGHLLPCHLWVTVTRTRPGYADVYGGVPERTNGAVLKTVSRREAARGFESHPRRSVSGIRGNHADCGGVCVANRDVRSTAGNRSRPLPRDSHCRAVVAHSRVLGKHPMIEPWPCAMTSGAGSELAPRRTAITTSGWCWGRRRALRTAEEIIVANETRGVPDFEVAIFQTRDDAMRWYLTERAVGCLRLKDVPSGAAGRERQALQDPGLRRLHRRRGTPCHRSTVRHRVHRATRRRPHCQGSHRRRCSGRSQFAARF
jgi:hypothetical protein